MKPSGVIDGHTDPWAPLNVAALEVTRERVTDHGLPELGPVWELRPVQWRDVVDVNVTGTFHAARPLLPVMIAADRDGSIGLISVGDATVPPPGEGVLR